MLFKASLLRLVFLVACFAIISPSMTTLAQTTPPPTYDNTVLNTTYIDLILKFTNIESFEGGDDQQYWIFLRSLCGLMPVTSNFYNQYHPSQLPEMKPSEQRCSIQQLPTLTMPSVEIRLSAKEHAVLPYESNLYLTSLIFRGTELQRHRFLDMILIHNRSTFELLGIVDAFVIQDITAVYDKAFMQSGLGFQLADESRSDLSAGWHVILVLLVLLIAGLIFSFKWRSRVSEKTDLIAEKEGEATDLTEQIQTSAHRWKEQNLQAEKNALVESAFAQEEQSNRIVSRSSAPTMETPLVGEGVSNNSFSSAQKKLTTQAAAFENALAWEPALNLPPKTYSNIVIQSTSPLGKKRQARMAQKKKDEEALLQVPDEGTTVLPPDPAQIKKEKEMKDAPLGLAARRMAMMMSTLAQSATSADQLQTTNLDPKVGMRSANTKEGMMRVGDLSSFLGRRRMNMMMSINSVKSDRDFLDAVHHDSPDRNAALENVIGKQLTAPTNSMTPQPPKDLSGDPILDQDLI